MRKKLQSINGKVDLFFGTFVAYSKLKRSFLLHNIHNSKNVCYTKHCWVSSNKTMQDCELPRNSVFFFYGKTTKYEKKRYFSKQKPAIVIDYGIDLVKPLGYWHLLYHEIRY